MKPAERKKTLERILSKAGLCSRTEARSWIGQGRVAVDGEKIQSPDAWVDPERQKITVDGRPLRAARKIYLLLYKPTGYLTTYRDPEGRPTIYKLLEGIEEKVFSAGRLDLETSGLLILTNDTAFADYITSPESHVPKTYLVKASARLTDEQLDHLRTGVVLADGRTRPAVVTRVRDAARATFFEITITEGRNRQVRRMVEGLGAKVLKLVRVRIGSIAIGDLQIGKYRELTERQVRELMPRREAPVQDRRERPAEREGRPQPQRSRRQRTPLK